MSGSVEDIRVTVEKLKDEEPPTTVSTHYEITPIEKNTNSNNSSAGSMDIQFGSLDDRFAPSLPRSTSNHKSLSGAVAAAKQHSHHDIQLSTATSTTVNTATSGDALIPTIPIPVNNQLNGNHLSPPTSPQVQLSVMSNGGDVQDINEKRISSSEENYTSSSTTTPREKQKKKSIGEKVKNYMKKKRQFVWFYLFVVGVLLGIISFGHDWIVTWLFTGRSQLIALFPNSWAAQFILWILYNVLLVTFSMVITLFFAPTAEGSGIPPVKALVNGAPLVDPISLPTLIFKIICLPVALGAGMFLGKVGPTTHIGAALANNLLNVPMFRNIRNNPSLRLQMIACGAGAGVGANFGTPTGGVLFALEVFGTYYSLRSYQKSFFVALIGAFTQRLLHASTVPSLTVTTVWKVNVATNYSMPELISAGILGALMGLFGAFFVFCNQKLLELRATFGKRKFIFFKIDKFAKSKFFTLFENAYLFTIVMAVVTSVVTFPGLIGNFMALPPAKMLEDLFRGEPLSSASSNASDWTSSTLPYMIFVNLIIFTVIRYVVTIFSVSLPLPGGMYIPLLVAGAGFGRLYGEVLKLIFPNAFGPTSQPLLAGGYAKIGAAALTAGATHAFSTCFILLEIVGIYFHLPTLLSALIAIRIARKFKPSVYDSIIALRKWPALVEANTDKTTLPVRKAMQQTDYLTQTVSVYRLRQYVDEMRMTPELKIHPIVKNNHKKHFLGVITSTTLLELHKQYCDFDKRINIELPVTSHSLNFNEDTPLLHAHIVFAMLQLDRAFVLNKGVLVGSLTRPDLSMIQKKKKNIYQKVTNRLKSRFSSKHLKHDLEMKDVKPGEPAPTGVDFGHELANKL